MSTFQRLQIGMSLMVIYTTTTTTTRKVTMTHDRYFREVPTTNPESDGDSSISESDEESSQEALLLSLQEAA